MIRNKRAQQSSITWKEVCLGGLDNNWLVHRWRLSNIVIWNPRCTACCYKKCEGPPVDNIQCAGDARWDKPQGPYPNIWCQTHDAGQASRSIWHKYESWWITEEWWGDAFNLYACQACLSTGGSELIMGTTPWCMVAGLKAEMTIQNFRPNNRFDWEYTKARRRWGRKFELRKLRRRNRGGDGTVNVKPTVS